jgi:hypothetical protein
MSADNCGRFERATVTLHAALDKIRDRSLVSRTVVDPARTSLSG